MPRSRDCVKEETIHLYVNPDDLRDWAESMEQKMKTTLPGQLVWTYPIFGKDGLKVILTADQEWFHDRAYWSKRTGKIQ